MEDMSLNRVKISILWIFEALIYVLYLGIVMTAPGVIDQLATRSLSGTPVEFADLVFSLLFIVILAMAFLTLVLKGSLNRWANVAVGAVFAVLEFLALTQLFATPFSPMILTTILKVVVPASISLLSYRWLKPAP